MNRRVIGSGVGFVIGTSARGVPSSSTPLKMAAPQVPPTRPSNSGQTVRARLKCFNCGEEGRRMNDCKKEARVNKGLLIENNIFRMILFQLRGTRALMCQMRKI